MSRVRPYGRSSTILKREPPLFKMTLSKYSVTATVTSYKRIDIFCRTPVPRRCCTPVGRPPATLRCRATARSFCSAGRRETRCSTSRRRHRRPVCRLHESFRLERRCYDLRVREECRTECDKCPDRTGRNRSLKVYIQTKTWTMQ